MAATRFPIILSKADRQAGQDHAVASPAAAPIQQPRWTPGSTLPLPSRSRVSCSHDRGRCKVRAPAGNAVAVSANLAGPDGPEHLIRDAEARLGPIDFLVSNAGLGLIRPLDAISIDDFEAAVAVNLRAPFLLAQRAIPAM